MENLRDTGIVVFLVITGKKELSSPDNQGEVRGLGESHGARGRCWQKRGISEQPELILPFP